MLYPKTTEEVREMILAARHSGGGLVPVSSGPPHFHGASVNPNAETLDLSRMDRVMAIDRRSRYVRVEAGVTFGDLLPQLAAHGLRLNLPFLPRPSKSAVASALEREAVLMPKYQYDYPDPLLTVETVFGTGDVFRTGSAAGPGTMEENTSDKVIPWGPGPFDYYRFLGAAQGTIGVVTWATLKAEVAPSASRLFFIGSASPDPLLDLAGKLLLDRVPDECVLLDRTAFSMAFAEPGQEDALRAALAPWTLLCRVCGYERYPEERVDIYGGYVADACAAFGLTAETEPPFPVDPAQIERMLTDCDRRDTYWKLRRGDERELLTLVPPSAAPAVLAEMSASQPDAGFIVSPQVQGRAFRIECGLYFEPDPRQAEKAEETLFSLAGRLVPLGAYFDRPYGRLPELLYSDPLARGAMKRLKSIFDPDNVLNPGKLCF
ncbi:MAG: FAD-binding oxidoreductase [Oscillospiraceae bacterium]|nr:FAD-binding oxidoreductase [Oscillospiraceae bacterium]